MAILSISFSSPLLPIPLCLCQAYLFSLHLSLFLLPLQPSAVQSFLFQTVVYPILNTPALTFSASFVDVASVPSFSFVFVFFLIHPSSSPCPLPVPFDYVWVCLPQTFYLYTFHQALLFGGLLSFFPSFCALLCLSFLSAHAGSEWQQWGEKCATDLLIWREASGWYCTTMIVQRKGFNNYMLKTEYSSKCCPMGSSTYFLSCWDCICTFSLLMSLGISVTSFLHAWHGSVFIYVSLIHINLSFFLPF